MKEYRIEFDSTFYQVQQKIKYGWWPFRCSIWVTEDFFWEYSGAEELYQTLTKL